MGALSSALHASSHPLATHVVTGQPCSSHEDLKAQGSGITLWDLSLGLGAGIKAHPFLTTDRKCEGLSSNPSILLGKERSGSWKNAVNLGLKVQDMKLWGAFPTQTITNEDKASLSPHLTVPTRL